jgi:hypothetical protein
MEKLGRLPAEDLEQDIILDAPEKTVQAILTKQDEIIAKLNQINAAIETATDAASLYTELDAIKSELKELEFYR